VPALERKEQTKAEESSQRRKMPVPFVHRLSLCQQSPEPAEPANVEENKI